VTPADWTERACGALLVATRDTMPPRSLGDAFAAASAVADIPTYRAAEAGVVGDHHPDATHPHSIRITATRPIAGAFRVVAIQDGEVLVQLDLDETVSGAVGYPSTWTDPGAVLAAMLSAIGTVVRGGVREEGAETALDAARRWALGVAAAACAAARRDIPGSMTASLPSPFTEGEIESSFFSLLPPPDRTAAYEAIEPMRRGAPRTLVAAWSADEPSRIAVSRLRIATTPPKGAVDGMRAILAAAEFNADATS
jgi:hypothetical protein